MKNSLLLFVVLSWISCGQEVNKLSLTSQLEATNATLAQFSEQVNYQVGRNFLETNRFTDLRRQHQHLRQYLSGTLDAVAQAKDPDVVLSLVNGFIAVTDSLQYPEIVGYRKAKLPPGFQLAFVNDLHLLKLQAVNYMYLLELYYSNYLASIVGSCGNQPLEPVVYTTQHARFREGSSVMYGLAYRIKDPGFMDMRIQSLTHNNQPVSTRNIEVDRNTQRFLVKNLKAGNYMIRGEVFYTTPHGIAVSYPFTEGFEVEK